MSDNIESVGNSVAGTGAAATTATNSINNNDIPNYLLNVFEKIAKENGFIEYRLEQEAGSKHGDGFVASMLSVVIIGTKSVHVDSNDSQIISDQLPLICKLMPTSTAHQESFDIDNIFQRELYTYNVIIPAIEKFQREKLVDNNERGFFQYPKCYAAVQNSETLEHFIIMEDLRPSGFKLFNKLEPIRYEHVRLLMIALGRLHGISMALREKYNEIWESFKPLPDLYVNLLCNKPAVRKMLTKGFELASKLFQSNPNELAIIKRLMQTWDTDIQSIVIDGAAEPFSVINHGDCWINNMLFLDDKEIRLLDFQICRIASPALDISYFLFTCTTKELRDQYLDEFFHIYHDSLTKIIHDCGCSTNFTFTEFEKQFKQFGKLGLIAATGFMRFMVTDPKDIGQLDEYFDNEKNDSNNDNDLLKLNNESEGELKKRIMGVLEDGKKFGWV